MPLISWDKSMSVQVDKIDEQHRKMIAMINELNEAMLEKKGKEVLGKIIHGLIGYSETHFKTEEDYFYQYGYPDAGNHKKQHTEFTIKVSEFKEDFDQGKIGLSVKVINFMSVWLRNHIMSMDMDYVPYFKEKGIK